MDIKQLRLGGWLLILVALMLGLMMDVALPAQPAFAEDEPAYQVLFPLVSNDHPLPLSVFGVEVNRGWVMKTLQKAQQAQVSWIRYNGILWHDVEAQRGVIDWSLLSDFEVDMIALNQAGIIPMVIIRGTPTWAQIPNSQYTGYFCGPIDDSALSDFANFVTAVVERYSKPPYNVHYWELGNEPDVDPDYVYPDAPYGCWGDDADTYYGAARYTRMLKVAFTAIKAADPTAKVILGGLLLDCDPTNSPSNYTCISGNFLEGILRNGGGQYLDIVAYHSYPFWYASTETDWDLAVAKWAKRGGTLLGKQEFLREVMARYGVNKPLMMNEGGLMCGYKETDSRYEWCQDVEFNHLQANYLVRMYIRGWSANLDGVAWYTLNGPGWREGGLLNSDSSPRVSYDSFEFLRYLLVDAKYVQQLAFGTLEGYEFVDLDSSGRRYLIYWSNDTSTSMVNLPADTVAVYDRYGNLQVVNDSQVQVGFDPIIIVAEP